MYNSIYITFLKCQKFRMGNIFSSICHWSGMVEARKKISVKFDVENFGKSVKEFPLVE